MLNLMYITNRPEVAQVAEMAGVDWIFVDMEFIDKDARQGGLDTVQNHHTIEDVANIKSCLTKSKLLVRINPIHDVRDDYFSSKEEVEATIKAGADIIMLPFFKTVEEVNKFLGYVNGRVQTCLLVETPEAVLLLDKILELKGIDMIHLGLNDLHLALGMKFMFELLADGTVDYLSAKIRAKGIPFGFGGIAKLNEGILSGASMVIVSRSFCNTDRVTDIDEIRSIFNTGIADIRNLEREAENAYNYFIFNRNMVVQTVQKIISKEWLKKYIYSLF